MRKIIPSDSIAYAPYQRVLSTALRQHMMQRIRTLDASADEAPSIEAVRIRALWAQKKRSISGEHTYT